MNARQAAGLAALDDSRFLDMTQAWFKAERKAICTEEAPGAGLAVSQSERTSL